MNIKKYQDYFHDGSIIDIDQKGTEILLSLMSAQIDPEDINDDMVLSDDDRISGILHLEGVKTINVSTGMPLLDLIKFHKKRGIFDFEVNEKKIEIKAIFDNYPRNYEKEIFAIIEIEAETIYWENIPEMEDVD